MTEAGESLYYSITAYARFNHVIRAGFSESEGPADVNTAKLKLSREYGLVSGTPSN